MKVLLLIVSLVLFFGPLRRPLFGNGRARFSIPAMVGFIIGLGIVFFATCGLGVPSGVIILIGPLAGLVMACLFGAEIKRWCDQVFGPRQQQQPQRRPRQRPRQ